MKTQFPQCPQRTIKEMTQFFYSEFLPNLSKEEAHIIARAIKWSKEEQVAYLMAMRYFEDPEV